jgi:hypothetical protein
MKKPILIVLLIGSLLLWLTDAVLLAPYLLVASEDAVLLRIPVKAGDILSLRYMHSVQKTLVIENIVIDQTGQLVVDSTEYESFGVGLPFLASEGKFHQVGNRFILEDIGRYFEIIRLRAGPEAQLNMQYHEHTYELYRLVPDGALIQMSVVPYYSTWLKQFAIERR